MATPNWQINLGGQHYDPERGEWISETNIADWAKPYVHEDGSYKSYKELKSAGLWDPTNAGLQRYFDALSNTGGSSMRKSGEAGDWRTNNLARSTLFGRLGLTTYDNPAMKQIWGYSDPRDAFGDFFEQGSYGDVERAREASAQARTTGFTEGLTDTAGSFVKEVGKNFVLPAAATYFGVNALGGALGGAGAAGAAGAEGAAAGGASAGGTGLTSALGGGITPGTTASGIGAGGLGTGLSPGVASTGIGAGGLGGGISGAAASGSALAPGFFAAEGPTAGAGGASGGATSLAPTNNGGILNTGIGATDLLRGLPGVIGAFAADQQADDYNRLANSYMQIGAPSRQRFEASFAPDFSMENEPGYLDALRQAARANAHALSVGSGNPYGNPNALMQSQADLYSRFAYPALQEYRRLNSGAGGLAQFAGAAPSAAGAGIQAQGNVFNSLGGAAADIFNPPSSLEQALKTLRGLR